MSDARTVLAELRAKTYAQVHGQPARRTYRTDEVKQIVYPLVDTLETAVERAERAEAEVVRLQGFIGMLSDIGSER